MTELQKIIRKAESSLGKKFSLLWPSREGTPPTESNITTACIEAFSSFGYHVFTEVPIKDGGLFDFVAYRNRRPRTLVLGEMKSCKNSYAKEILHDYDRMKKFRTSDFEFSESIKPLITYTLIGYWTQKDIRIRELKNMKAGILEDHPLAALFRESDFVDHYEIPTEKLNLFFFAKRISKAQREN